MTSIMLNGIGVNVQTIDLFRLMVLNMERLLAIICRLLEVIMTWKLLLILCISDVKTAKFLIQQETNIYL